MQHKNSEQISNTYFYNVIAFSAKVDKSYFPFLEV